MPGRRTLPATSTVTVPGAAPVDGPPDRAGAGRVARPARPVRRRGDQRGRRRRGQRGASCADPRTSHQQVTASPTATRTATTASWAAPSAGRALASLGGRAAPAPAAARRRAGRVWARAAAAAGGRRGAAGRVCSSHHGAVVRSVAVGGSRPGRAHAARWADSSALSSASRRETAAWCSGLGRRVRMPANARKIRRPPPGRTDAACGQPGATAALWTSSAAVRAAGRRRPRACPARRARRARRRARRTRPRGPRGCPRAASPAARCSCPARSGLARCATQTSTGVRPGGLHGQLLQPGQRASRGPHPLQGGDPAVGDLQQRLHRQRAAEQRRRGADPAAAAQVLQGVDVEQRATTRRRAPARPRPPPRRSRRRRRRRRPTARRTRSRPRPAGCPRVRPGTDASRAASCADSKVPLMSPDRCTETISVAPSRAHSS